MRLDMEKLIPGILFGTLLFIIMNTAMSDVGVNTFDVSQDQNNSVFIMNNTITQANVIEKNISSTGVDSLSTYIPGIKNIFKVWDLLKAPVEDLREALNMVYAKLPVSHPLLKSLIVALMTSIGLTMAFIVLRALFKSPGFKQ